MKKILYSILMLFIISCNKELQENPKSLAVENFYNTPSEVDAAIGAIYSPLRVSDCFGAVYQAIQEASSDVFVGRASFAPTSEFQGLNGTNITRVGKIWNNLYLSIRNANLVIKNTPNGKSLSDEMKNRYIGEAKFLRALSYFFLVRNWGGVIIRTEQNMDVRDEPRRSSEDVYKLIIEDLKFAEINLPDAPLNSGRPSKWAAKTVLSDVYFYQGDYTDATTKANEIIQVAKYSLVQVTVSDDFNKLFGPTIATSPEEIFYLKYSELSPWAFPIYTNGVNTPYLGINGYYAIYSNTENPLYKNWDDNDFRKSFGWYKWNVSLGPNIILNKKFIDPGELTPRNDYPLYRYADLLLIYAEASCQAAGAPTSDGIEKLNMVHRRAYGYDPLQPSSVDFKISNYDKQSFIDLVVKERGYETQAEGKRWLDLKRTGKAADYINAAWGKTILEKALLWPIPISELNYNKGLDPTKDQNPGY